MKISADTLRNGAWNADVSSLGAFAAIGVKFLRFLSTALFGFVDHRCGLHAAGLTYFSLLAIVPILCLLMVFAKTCGAGDFAREKTNAYISTFISDVEKGSQGTEQDEVKPEEAEKKRLARAIAVQAREFSNQLFDRIDKFDISTFGWIGFAMLMWTVVSTFGQIEASMNEIWYVAAPRPLWKRFVMYLFIACVLPLLSAAALSLPVLKAVRAALDATLGASSYTKWIGDACLSILDSRLFAFAITLTFASIAFAFLLAVIPNRKVKVLPAIEGGIITALLFGGIVRLCTTAQVGIGKSSAFYGSFSAPIILLAWIYMSWQIVLLGSNIVYALQCVHNGSRDCPVT